VHEALLEDPEVQKNGVVFLLGTPRIKSPWPIRTKNLTPVAPRMFVIHFQFVLRIVAIHHYASSRLLLGSFMQVQYQLHMGEEDKYLEELEEYGITPQCLPQDMGGISSFDYSEWLEQRRVASL
jgi:hypothetical protein